jgi:hypothetical protein
MTVTMTFIYGRPPALQPAFDSPAPQTGAHAFVVGQPSVQGQVPVQILRVEQPKNLVRPKNPLGWAQTVPSTAVKTITTGKTHNYNGTTSAKGAGMAKSLRDSGGVPPRGRPV